MEVIVKNWNLDEVGSEISIFNRDEEQLNIIVDFRVWIWFVQLKGRIL